MVALFGSTPLGSAADKLVRAVPPFAKKAGYAKTAGFAKRAGNATTVNAIKAARTPKAGYLVPLGADGKFPTSVGASGPAGPTGPAGAAGPAGPAGTAGKNGATNVVLRFGTSVSVPALGIGTASAACNAGERVTGGGYFAQGGEVLTSRPSPLTNGAAATSWTASLNNTTGSSQFVGAYVMCAAP